jgi:hypothetical protein
MLLGFSVSSLQPSAKAADSTPKSARLHYSLPLPEAQVSLEQDDAPAPIEIENDHWESVIIKSGDSLASIFAKKGISSTTTYQIAKLNDQTGTGDPSAARRRSQAATDEIHPGYYQDPDN